MELKYEIFSLECKNKESLDAGLLIERLRDKFNIRVTNVIYPTHDDKVFIVHQDSVGLNKEIKIEYDLILKKELKPQSHVREKNLIELILLF